MYAIRELFLLNGKTFYGLMITKKELFHYLAKSLTSISQPVVDIVSSFDQDVISSTMLDKEGLTNCNHEEADTRLFLHIRHAAAQGLKKVIIRTIDTDVVVLAIANAHNLYKQTSCGYHLARARIRGTYTSSRSRVS